MKKQSRVNKLEFVTNTRLLLLVARNQAGIAVRFVVDIFCTGVLVDAENLFSFSLGVGLEPPLRLPPSAGLVFGRAGVTGSRLETLR